MESMLEIDLDKADALAYRAEGNANLVLSLPAKYLVLRLRKSVDKQNDESPMYNDTKANFLNTDADLLELQRSVDYTCGISNLFGHEYTVPANIVSVTTVDYAAFNRRLQQVRPNDRLAKGVFCRYGVVYPDVAFLPVLLDAQQYDTFSVEIKPKQGWTMDRLQAGEKCRYCSLQYLKLQKGAIDILSKFCPIDLFSGVHSRMTAAINELLLAPQNNFRLFRNGKLIYGNGHSPSQLAGIYNELFPTCSSGCEASSFTDLVVAILLHEYEKASPLRPQSEMPQDLQSLSDSTGRCIESVPNGLPSGCVLSRVRNLQLLVKSSMEHMNELEQKCDDQQPQHLKITKNTISVRSLDIPEQYSVGATSLDCSVMLTFKRLENSQQRSFTDYQHQHVITVGQQSFMTKAIVMDLDEKSPQQHYTKYKQQIRESLTAYENFLISSKT